MKHTSKLITIVFILLIPSISMADWKWDAIKLVFSKKIACFCKAKCTYDSGNISFMGGTYCHASKNIAAYAVGRCDRETKDAVLSKLESSCAAEESLLSRVNNTIIGGTPNRVTINNCWEVHLR